MRFIWICFLLMIHVLALSQVRISGVVQDEYGEAVSYADVFFDKADKNTYTDTDGTFYLESEQTYSYFTVSGFEFEDKVVEINQGSNLNLKIILKQKLEGTSVQLSDIEVKSSRKRYKNKRENPAYAILKKLWQKRRENGLKKFPNYAYDIYEKVQLDLNNIDSTFFEKGFFKDFKFLAENIDTSRITGATYLPIFINESLYKVWGENNPVKFRKDLHGNKSSGFQGNDRIINTIKNLYREIDIYDNRINFFNKAFVSPVAKDGFSVYDYELIDTAEVQGKPCFRIKYSPLRDRDLTFRGDFCVDSATYALSDIMMQSTRGINVNFVNSIYTEMEFELANDSIFLPKREYFMLDLSVLDKKKKSKGLYAHKTMSYENYDFQTIKPNAFYDEKWEPFKEGVYERDSTYWSVARAEDLSKDEKQIYIAIDSLEKTPQYKKIIRFVDLLSTGYYKIYDAVNIGHIYSFFGVNDVEGVRLKTEVKTFFSPNDRWRLSLYGAYGMKDRKFKYGGEFKYLLSNKNRWKIGGGYKKDIEQLGSKLTLAEGILDKNFGSAEVLSTGKNERLSHIELSDIFVSVEPWENIKFRLDLIHQRIKSANPDKFSIDYRGRKGEVLSELKDSYLSLALIARPGAKYSRHGVDRFRHKKVTLNPTFLFRYTHGFRDVFQSEFVYDKLTFYYNQAFLIGSVGKTDVTTELGKTFQPLPLSLLSVVPGNKSYRDYVGTFSMLDYYEFITDTYATLQIDHHFEGFILNKIPLINRLKLRSVIFGRSAWGQISNLSSRINATNQRYIAPEKPYFEYGFGIENIGWESIRPLRINFNWRGNYRDYPDAQKFKVSFIVALSF